ncbi:hypothetical protein I302_105659 [Kwoniella bestiolae CBS 10118]|uniref:Fork-head domain-containing protein n=1 Tax=Kwoniella bestiolae CBS 10118 TaxID=1296100 RepID=A0A1B9G1R5_9TREE|nr:hypothetical protein I302_04777 [Kwoniella bestiolae CBS 10118]OCF24967.1 hypothetical protein I302_04777 [Kwoniella bestiolae CBS 10118]
MPDLFAPQLPEAGPSSNHQTSWEGEEELFPEDDDDEPPSSPLPPQPILHNTEPPINIDEPGPEPEIDPRPMKKAKRLKPIPLPPSLTTTSPIIPRPRGDPDHEVNTNPKRPKIKPSNLFWRKPPPPVPHTSGSSRSEERNKKHREFPFSDSELNLRTLTWPAQDDLVVKTLGIAASLPTFQNPHDPNLSIGAAEEIEMENNRPFIYTRSDLIRYRLGKTTDHPHSSSKSGERERERGEIGDRGMSIAQGAWRRWEEVGGVPKGLAGVIPYSFDGNGEVYKPDLTHVQAIRLVIAASPRGRMTLSQIYQAFEDRWPWHKTAGMTWKNSIRHNLSLNDCFINIEKATTQGGGKGGYWIVDNSLSGRTARKLKRSAPSSSTDPNPSPTKSTFSFSFSERERDLLTKDRLSITTSTSASTSNDSSPSARTPSVDVFSPIASSSTHAHNPLDRYNRNTLIGVGVGGKDKKIAKPAVPFPYQLPKRDKSWVPTEVVRKSREIGIQRPAHDTPLDRAGPPGAGEPREGGWERAHIPQSIGPPFQHFTTRAGIPELPMVHPKPTSHAGQRGEGGEREGRMRLPGLIKAVYEIPDELGMGNNAVRLPPVRIPDGEGSRSGRTIVSPHNTTL